MRRREHPSGRKEWGPFSNWLCASWSCVASLYSSLYRSSQQRVVHLVWTTLCANTVLSVEAVQSEELQEKKEKAKAREGHNLRAPR